MAVCNGREKVVTNMVDFLVLEVTDATLPVGDYEQSLNVKTILAAGNDRMNTPLHLAAKMGNSGMCRKISSVDPSLIARRNIAGETPLFLAALYGHKEAFLLFRNRIEGSGVSSTDFAHCWIRDNGDTILHCAIAQGHIGVTVKIVHLYKNHMKEMMKRNKEGLSPLHLLAAKHSAFKSTRLVEFVLPMYSRWFHQWLQIMNELLQHASGEDISQIISRTASEQFPIFMKGNVSNESESTAALVSGTITIETPLMIATKNGVVEMVDKILELFPSRIKEVNSDGKNILMLAAEYRQKKVFEFLCEQKWLKESDVFWQVDKEGNNALHLAARLGVEPDWLNPYETLRIFREIKWFEFVKRRMPHDLWERYNREMMTPEDIFKESHKELMKSEGEWVAQTSKACSVVSILVLSAAFGGCTNKPGGDEDAYDSGFDTSIVTAFFLSLISTICFLSLVASPSQSVHTWRYVPFKLYFGTTSMFISILFLWYSLGAAVFFNQKRDSLWFTMLTLAVLALVIAQLCVFTGTSLPSPICQAARPIEYRRTLNKEKGTDLNCQH